MKSLVLLFVSLLLVAFGQSSFVSFLGIGAASVGYALFWFALLSKFQGKKERFWLSVSWYALVQGIQLSWFCSTKYMGSGILVVYVFVVFLLALQFGCLSFFFKRSKSEWISLRNCFAIAGAWALLEWTRLFLFTGFPWNPAGLALASNEVAIQFAALFGVYGLSFWVIFVNAFALYALKSWKRGAVWACLACTPYLYGLAQQALVEQNVPLEKNISVALVQTGILPEQKDRFPHQMESYIPPLNQWERIWSVLREAQEMDLIVLPETAVAMRANQYVYPLEMVEIIWADYFGEASIDAFPPLQAPFAKIVQEKGWRVTNLFISQALANHFNARVIAGFVDRDASCEYNAAFDLTPYSLDWDRYEKRVLVPIGEYVPMKQSAWVSNFLSEQFGIGDSFSVGTDAKVFSCTFPVGISICAEETYSHLIRDLKLQGARLFVNITNDVWFPGSHLPWQHFQHGCMRSAENGVCSLRACNTGVTSAIDCCGKVLGTLDPSEEKVDVLFLSVPVRSFSTLYTFWGDSMILVLSALFVLFSFRRKTSLESSSG